jgi:hypothetical protein
MKKQLIKKCQRCKATWGDFSKQRNEAEGGRLEDYLLLGRDKREAVNAEETGKEAFLLLVNPHHMESKGQAV